MKKFMYWMAGVVLALGILMVGAALFAKGEIRTGLVAGELSPCPNTPNCVCSEDPSASSYIDPFAFNDTAESAWQQVKLAVVSSGGNIQQEEQAYLWATYTTKWLRFVDDVELRMDTENRVIHVRSASRIGRSDFGVNRKRVEMLRILFNSERMDTHASKSMQ